jgi:DNA-binding SARP family transcriptional activator
MSPPTRSRPHNPAGHAASAASQDRRSRQKPLDSPSALIPAPLADLPAEQGEVWLAPVIRSKIQPPPVRASTLSRQRLLDRLAECTGNRLTLIVAEAGYGKTTLLADFSARSANRMLWFKLDSTDADCVTWANYLVAAVREVEPNFGSGTMSLLSHMATGGPPKPVIIGTLVAELAALAEAPTTLVLDDFHLVDESPDVAEFVSRLLRDGPAWLHVVIATRRMPDLQLGRLAAMGEFAEVGTDELRFSRAETEQLFTDGYGQPLEEEVLTDVEERTRGWAASLQLFYGSIRGRPANAVRSLARSLSGATSPIYDFLAEEVLGNISPELEDFLTRAALLDRILAGHVVALFADREPGISIGQAQHWIEEADRLGLLTQTSQSSETRQLHPLLRDFLLGHLGRRYTRDQERQMHLRLAQATTRTDPLTACQHYVAAGANSEAMALLGKSVMLTMGSGQWGIAAQLIDKVDGVPLDPAVAAIRARSLMDEGDLAGAARALEGTDIADSVADVRAVFRHARLSLGWRTADHELMFATLREIESDGETPPILRDIARVFVDASPVSPTPARYPDLATRLESMSKRQRNEGHPYYAAISLHNASIAEAAAGRPSRAIALASRALQAFADMQSPPTERYSTHAVLAACHLDLGERDHAEQEMALALSSGEEHADVYAELAFLAATIGDGVRAEQMLALADRRSREGLTDLQAITTATFAQALIAAPTDPTRAISLLDTLPRERPLDVGDTLTHQVLKGLAHLLQDDPDGAIELVASCLPRARAIAAEPARTRLDLIGAIAADDAPAIRANLAAVRAVGHLGILMVADALASALHLLQPIPDELSESIQMWPERWLPLLRRQLGRGNDPTARVAATLLDEHGNPDDVIRLRAYDKTYRRRVAVSSPIGRRLAKRLAPRLMVRDLGRVELDIGDRRLALGEIRRKPATLLMYLITRPDYTATREQVLDELWPVTDPASANNSLNQSLYYLRRSLDEWYEDDVSADYLRFQSDIVWLDSELVSASSSDFMRKLRALDLKEASLEEVLGLVKSYPAPFAPEFEYEEWAIAWRSRLHAAYLEFATRATDELSSRGHLGDAREVATRVFETDPTAQDVERRIVWLYWHLGARSAAAAQYRHLAGQDRSDGLEPEPLKELVKRPIRAV